MQPRLLLIPLLLAAVLPASPPASASVPDGPWVVIAVVDSGINPYHAEFAAPALQDPPSTYLQGYPSTATRLDLTLGASHDYAAARAADASKWASLPKAKLHWIPGTKIVGAYDAGDEGFLGAPDTTPVLDDHHHGTSVATIAAGNTLGRCPQCLLVVVEDAAGLAWATRQPWIDVVVNAWGTVANAGFPPPVGQHLRADTETATRAGAECGQTVVFASGNGYEAFLAPEQTYLSNEVGPSWVLRVAGYFEDSAGRPVPVWGNGKPADVLGRALRVPTAAHDARAATKEFSGTSAAAPDAAGLLADVLRDARAQLGDVTEGGPPSCAAGSARQVLATGASGSGLLSDGKLTRAELWSAFLATARPTGYDGLAFGFPAVGAGADAAAPLNEGWGLVDGATRDAAQAALRGAPPARPDVEGFARRDAALREVVWGPWDRDGDGVADPVPLADAWTVPLA